jgi:hypothetical protein
MWTQNFNFKLNVYTRNTVRAYSVFLAPTTLPLGVGVGGGGRGDLILSQSREMWLRTKITNITPKCRTVVPRCCFCSRYSVIPGSIRNMTDDFQTLQFPLPKSLMSIHYLLRKKRICLMKRLFTYRCSLNDAISS